MGTIVAALVVLVVLALGTENWHPEFAQGVIIGAGITFIGGFFLMIKEVVSSTIEIVVGDD